MVHHDNLAWHPWLQIAAVGAVLVFVGIVFQAIQLIVSIRERAETRDFTGDPWNGRTLEWAIASPAPFCNFGRVPVVEDLDALTDMKERDVLYKRPGKFEAIHMPKNTGLGFILGVFAFLFGFAMVWHIWWMAIASRLAMVSAVVVRANSEDVDYYVPAEEVERLENCHYGRLLIADVFEDDE